MQAKCKCLHLATCYQVTKRCTDLHRSRVGHRSKNTYLELGLARGSLALYIRCAVSLHPSNESYLIAFYLI